LHVLPEELHLLREGVAAFLHGFALVAVLDGVVARGIAQEHYDRAGLIMDVLVSFRPAGGELGRPVGSSTGPGDDYGGTGLHAAIDHRDDEINLDEVERIVI
jgi:hypothetical protein